MRFDLRASLLLLLAATGALASATLQAAPFASNVVVSGNNVSFILNEPADTLGYRINNGPFVPIAGAGVKGTKNFLIGNANDKFGIIVGKSAPTGYTIPTGGPNIAADLNGLSQATAPSGHNVISVDADLSNRFNSPRGVDVSNDPDSPKFGTVYVANSAAGSTGAPVRALGDGLYALHADQSDAFGYGNTASDPGNKFDSVAASANSPYKVTVAANGEVYVSDFSDANGNIWRLNSNMTTGSQTLTGVGGPAVTPGTQDHGSTSAVQVTGSIATGDLVVYTLDEDLRSSDVVGGPVTNDRNSLWRYNIGAGPVPSAVLPTKVNTTNVLVELAASDLDVGADGKFYLMQNRAAGNEAGIVVLDTNGVKIYDSKTASGGGVDILRNLQGMAVSEDQKWMALMLNNSDVAVVPLDANGLPVMASRLLVDTGTNVNSGRDIAFDAAGNIHYVTSGRMQYQVIAPGGTTWARTIYRAGDMDFYVNSTGIPEPSSLGLIGGACMVGLDLVRRRRMRSVA